MIDASGLKVPGKSYHLANKAIDYALSSLTPVAMTWNDNGLAIEPCPPKIDGKRRHALISD